MKKFKSCVIVFMLVLASFSVFAELSKSDRQKIVDFLLSINQSELAAEIEKNNLNAKNEAGATALMYVAYRNNIEIAKLLIKAGADVNAKNEAGTTALMCAVWENNIEIAKLLIEAGADVNAKVKVKGMGGTTALMDVAYRNNIEIAKLLIKAGADVNAKDEDGAPALMYAVGENNIDIAKLLIKAGADVNAKDEDGTPALMYAVRENNIDIAKLLIKAGADVNAKTMTGMTALSFVDKLNWQEMKEMLIAAGAQTYAEIDGVKHYYSDQSFFSAIEAMSRNKNAVYTYMSILPKEEIHNIVLRFGSDMTEWYGGAFDLAYLFIYQYRNYRISVWIMSKDNAPFIFNAILEAIFEGGISGEIIFQEKYITPLQQQEIMDDLKTLVEKLMY